MDKICYMIKKIGLLIQWRGEEETFVHADNN